MKDYDCFSAVVIGSGFGGAVTACRLVEAGLRVCILERGRRFEPSSDLPVLPAETFWPPPNSDGDRRKLPDFTRAFWRIGQGLWDVRDLGDLVVGQAAGFGGGSLIYANVHLRAPDEVFETWPAPLRGPTLQPYYDLAAFMLDVQAPPEDLPKTAAFEKAAARLAADGRVSEVFRPPLAVNFEAVKENEFGRKQGTCDLRGECLIGCKQAAKNTLDLNYLAAAEAGGAEVRTLAEVVSIHPIESEGDYRYRVRYRDQLTPAGTEQDVWARYVFLCAGAVNSTELLLRSRRDDVLPVASGKLGTGFYPNADELAVVFDCDEEQEADRGPTITSSFVYYDGDNWLLVQDGGLPTHLEPLLGIFRSPLWLQRNGFAKPGADSVALPQRVGYADLPVSSVFDLLAQLTGSAITDSPQLQHDVAQALFQVARQQPSDAQQPFSERPAPGKWALCPDQLRTALAQIRQSTLADVTLASEPFVQTLIERAAARLPGGLLDSLGAMAGRFDVSTVPEEELRRWALNLAVQSLWGSQAGLLGAVAMLFDPFVDPARLNVLASDLLKWALDYRAGDGHAAVLLTFGRDSQSATLELASERIAVGTAIRGRSSEARGVVVHDVDGRLTLADVRGEFRADEVVLAASQPIGTCRDWRVDEVRLALDKGEERSLSLGVLHVARGDRRDRRRFRSDSYQNGEWEASREQSKRPAALRARLPKSRRTPERSMQERLLRDVASELGGELRTDPLWPFMGRRITVHAQGGCPMADSPDGGVTRPSGEVYGCDGLYVMDAAAFPTPVGVNPSATIAAVAEWKVEQFLVEELKKDGWRAKQTNEAAAWARERQEMLNPAVVGRPKPPNGVVRPHHAPIGIRFREVMKGTHRSNPANGADAYPELAIETHLEAWVDDLAEFLAADADGDHEPLKVSGRVCVSWADERSRQYAVDTETSSILVSTGSDEYGNPTRSIEYKLHFQVEEADGVLRDYVLDGLKDIRDDARFDAWEDTTTLTFVLERAGDAEPCGWGVLRLSADAFFGTQLRSIEATNTNGDPAREAWALMGFGRFFFGHLVDVYLPALDRIADLGRLIARRGHA